MNLKVKLCAVFTCGMSCFLPPSAGIAVGFYGNGESSDGAARLAYSFRHANRTVSGVEKLVSYPPIAKNLFIYLWKTFLMTVFFFLGVRQRPSLKPDCGGELGPVRDSFPGSDRLCVHRPEAPGTAG